MMKPPRIIDLAANQAFSTVLATVYCRRWIVRESLIKADGATPNTPQGFQIQAADNSTSPGTFGPLQVRPAADVTDEPGNFPEYAFPEVSDATFHGHEGCPVARGPDTPGAGVAPTPAQPLCKVASFTNTATSIEVIEEY